MGNKFKKPKMGLIYSIWLLITLLFIVFSYRIFTDNIYYAGNNDSPMHLQPDSVIRDDDNTFTYMLTIPESADNFSETLVFYTNHKETLVYSGDDLLFSRMRYNSVLGHSTGSCYNFINVAGGSQLRITIHNVYPGANQTTPDFIYGKGKKITEKIIYDSLFSALAGILMVSIGFLLMVYWRFSKKEDLKHYDVMYLGLFAIIFGLWSLNETAISAIIIPNRNASSYVAFTLLMNICIPFIMFEHEFMESTDKYIHNIIILYCIAEAVICQTLQFFNILDLKQTAIFTHLAIVISLIYLLYTIVNQLLYKKDKTRAYYNIIGLIILVISAVLDLTKYYSDSIFNDAIGKIGFLIYIVILGIQTAKSSARLSDDNRKLELYREMAYRDLLTDCYNRNAYNEAIEKTEKSPTTYIVTFDLNNLKLCNDNLGHTYGDHYLMDAAKILFSVYGNTGNLYRIGGDEFCVICEKSSDSKQNSLRNALAKEVRFYNSHAREIKMGIASGYAYFDKSVDTSYEDTRDRADEMMYKNKKDIKNKNESNA